MSRKDYRLIAEAIDTALKQHACTLESAKAIAKQLAIRLKNDNSLFKEDIFFRACGLED